MRPIAIRLSGMRALVSRAHAGLVLPLLEERVIQYRSDAGGMIGRRTTFRLFREEGEAYAFSAKLAWTISAELKQRQCDASIIPALGERLPSPDPRLLRHPAFAAGALVRFGGHAHPHVLVLDLLRAYPTARTVVAVPNRDAIRTWIHRLRAAELGRPVVSGREYATTGVGPGWAVVVTSFDGLDHCQPYNFDLGVVPDARPLRGVDPRPPDLTDPHAPRDYRLLRTWYRPAFGFLPANLPLSPGEEQRMRVLFAQSVSIGTPRPAHVRVVPVVPPGASGRLPDPEWDRLRFKREAIWANRARNDYLVRLANGVAGGGPSALEMLGLDGPPGMGRRVVVLVEGAHAKVLADQMPGWRVLSGSDPAPDDRSERVIGTDFWAANQRVLDADVVIDARGGAAIEFRGFPPPGSGEPEDDRTVTVVDLADQWPPPAAAMTRRRHRDYANRPGWSLQPPSRRPPHRGRGR